MGEGGGDKNLVVGGRDFSRWEGGGGVEQIFDRWGEDSPIPPVEKTLDLLVISYKILH